MRNEMSGGNVAVALTMRREGGNRNMEWEHEHDAGICSQ